MKESLFKPLYWIMLILISIDFIDTCYRISYGYFSGQGIQPPVGGFNVQISMIDFIVALIIQLGTAYAIYMLYNMQKKGGYYFIGLNIIFLLYGFILGPFASVPALETENLAPLYFKLFTVEVAVSNSPARCTSVGKVVELIVLSGSLI